MTSDSSQNTTKSPGKEQGKDRSKRTKGMETKAQLV